MISFFHDICIIPKEKIKARVHIYLGMNYKKLLFWSKVINLPKENFYKPQNQISIIAGDTVFTCKVKEWIQGIIE